MSDKPIHHCWVFTFLCNIKMEEGCGLVYFVGHLAMLSSHFLTFSSKIIKVVWFMKCMVSALGARPKFCWVVLQQPLNSLEYLGSVFPY